MRSSNLINPETVQRALRDILKGLANKDLLLPFQELLESSSNPRLVHTFPAFNLLTPGREFVPYKWFLPKPRVSILEFLAIYEKFALAVRDGVDNPATVASAIYSRHNGVQRLLTHFSHESCWLAAGHTLLASALWLGAELEANVDGLVRMRLGTGLLEVSAEGVWSNADRTVYPSRVVPASHVWPVAPFPHTRSDNPILHAVWMWQDNLEPSLLWAATTLAIALKEEVVSREFLRIEAGRMARKLRFTSRHTPEGMEYATAAMQQCADVLADVQVNVVQALYEAAVPGLMNSVKFRALFGVPSQSNPLRVVGPETRRRWQEKLERVSVELHSADI